MFNPLRICGPQSATSKQSALPSASIVSAPPMIDLVRERTKSDGLLALSSLGLGRTAASLAACVADKSRASIPK